MKNKTPDKHATDIRIVFIDLDLTLFDYTAAREKGAIKAMKELSKKSDIKDYFLVYLALIENWRAFELLGFVDIKRYWNHLSIYFLVYLFTSTHFRIHTNSFFKILKKLQANSENGQAVSQIKAQNKKLIASFNSYYLSIKDNKDICEKAKLAGDAFETATDKLRPFNGAKSLLTNLRESGYYFFIVTEGDQGIQSEKIKKLSLSTLVKPSRLIVTNGLSNSIYLSQKIDEEKKALLEQLNFLPNQKNWLSLQLSSLNFIQKKLNLFNYKKDRHFYGHAIHIAVSQVLGKHNEKGFSNISPSQWEKLPPIKIATLGDRYSNDIRPLLKIFNDDNLLSLQLLYGKYQHEKLKKNDKKPDFHIQRLIQAKNIIIQDKYWAQKNPISRPKHFYLSANKSLIWHSAIGLTLPKPIGSIAESILQDAGYSQSKITLLKSAISSTVKSTSESKDLAENLQGVIVKIL